jgi:hypothetical protein
MVDRGEHGGHGHRVVDLVHPRPDDVSPRIFWHPARGDASLAHHFATTHIIRPCP